MCTRFNDSMVALLCATAVQCTSLVAIYNIFKVTIYRNCTVSTVSSYYVLNLAET